MTLSTIEARINLLNDIADNSKLLSALERVIDTSSDMNELFTAKVVAQYHTTKYLLKDLRGMYTELYMNPLEGKVEEVSCADDPFCDCALCEEAQQQHKFYTNQSRHDELVASIEAITHQMIEYNTDSPIYKELARDLKGTERAFSEFMLQTSF